MFDNLTALGYGIVTFAVIIGIGVVLTTQLGKASLTCNSSLTWNGSTCVNASGWKFAAGVRDLGQANATLGYMTGQLGQSGLAGWTPAIIALTIGMLFLGVFVTGLGRGRKY